MARQLAERLCEREITVWPDKWEDVSLEDGLNILQRTDIAAVLIGHDGPDAQQETVIRACVHRMTQEELNVIPVILPDATIDSVPPILQHFICVDMGRGLSDVGLDRLQWGITGMKPEIERESPTVSRFLRKIKRLFRKT